MTKNREKTRTVVERIRSLRKAYGLTQIALARKLGVTQSIVSLVESGKSSVSINFLKKMAENFDVSLDWLVHGKDTFSRYNTANFVPLIERKVHADYIKHHKDTEYLETLQLYKIPGFEKGNFRIFEVSGDSMVPSIYESDKLIVSGVDSVKDIIEGKIYVLLTQDDIVVKRVFINHNDPDFSLILRSDNNTYQDMHINVERVLEVWKVEAKITSSFLKENIAINQRINDLEENITSLKDEMKRLVDSVSQARNGSS